MSVLRIITSLPIIYLCGIAFGLTISQNEIWKPAPQKESKNEMVYYHNRLLQHSEKNRYNQYHARNPKEKTNDEAYPGHENADVRKTLKNDGCIERDVTFYRHFDEAVDEITGGVKIENRKDECVCTRGKFTFCDCSILGLNEVPIDLSSDVNGLDLSGNFIHNLPANIFQRYSQLKYLSLQNNTIDHLSVRSFVGLSQLRVLDLKDNKLSMSNRTYPPGVFKDLSSLIALRINKNTEDPESPDLFYPVDALSDLTSLKLLSMDGLRNKSFGAGFGNLKSLETLSLSGYLDGVCKIFVLTNDSFQYLSQLKMLNVSDCFLQSPYIETNALQYLQNIHTLDFTWNEDITIKKMAKLLKVLTNSGMKELFIRRVEFRFQSGITVHKKYAETLPRNLTCLVASGNSVNVVVGHTVFGVLPPKLRYLDFSGNKLVFGKYIEHIYKMKNLEILYLNGPDYNFEIPRHYPYRKPKSGFDSEEGSQDQYPQQTERKEVVIRLPPKLRILKMEYAGLWYRLTRLAVDQNNSLEELYLRNNFFPTLIGPFKGFNKLKKLEMSSCLIKDMYRSFFEHFPALEHLNLYSNFIGMGSSLFHQPFRNLTNLKYLNISFNDILYLNQDTFSGLSELRELHIANNTVFEFIANISHMSKLQILDMKTTSLHTLSPATRRHIDSLRNISVLISFSPLYCDCSHITFLDWITHQNDHVIPRDLKYICVLENRASLTMDWNHFFNQIRVIKRECVHNYGLFLFVLGVTLLLLVLVIGSIMYRFRWRLRYLYYGIHLWITQKNVEKPENKFIYDVFVSYSNEDENFVLRKVCPQLQKRGLKICTHFYDFCAGDHVIDNIIRCVRASKKTLIILTKHFVASKWCQCEFQMAKEESLVSGRKILVFLIVHHIPKNKIGREILTHIHQNTYMPYHEDVDTTKMEPQDAENQSTSSREAAMWDKLVRDMGM